MKRYLVYILMKNMLQFITSALNDPSETPQSQTAGFIMQHQRFLLQPGWTCQVHSYGIFPPNGSLESGTIKHGLPQGDCAVKQQYFIHDSDRGLPLRLRRPFFSCTT